MSLKVDQSRRQLWKRESSFPSAEQLQHKSPKLIPREEATELRKIHFCAPVGETDHDGLRIVHAMNQYMYSEDGIRYLDMRNNVHHVGHSHPRVVEACVNQMSLLNTNSRFLHDEMLKLAKRLSDKSHGLTSCIFVNSGSEANDLALQIAENITGGTEIISLQGAYHGHLKSLRAISSHEQKFDKKPDYAHFVSLPCTYRGKYRNKQTAGKLYADEIKTVIDKCHSANKRMAGFICEPLPCCAGQIVLPEEYLKTAYHHVRSAGGLCIADEIQSGYGRIGSHFWAFELQGVVPDIITIGKPMGNGHPVAAVITTKEIADKFAATGIEYFNTFGGNPVSMAIARTVLDVLEEEKLQENAKNVGAYMKEKLESLKHLHDIVGNVRGVGLLLGVEFVKDQITREPATKEADTIKKRLANDCKILCLTDGKDKNVLKLKPPMCITKEDVDYFVVCLDSTLANL